MSEATKSLKPAPELPPGLLQAYLLNLHHDFCIVKETQGDVSTSTFWFVMKDYQNGWAPK